MADTYRFIVNRSRDFITLIDREYRYAIVNDSYCTAIERPREEILNHSVADVWGVDRFEQTIKPKLDECLAGSEVHFLDEFRFGSMRKSLHVSLYPYDVHGETTHALVFSHDITHLAEIESKLARYEYRDRTTGLYNRRSLEEMLVAEIERARRSSGAQTKGLLFVSLRSFKKINQNFGHHIGDLLLEHTANRVREVIRSSDIVFRFDGTNLVVLLTSIARPTDAAMVAQKISDEVAVPYQYHDQVITIDSHIGISLYPDDADDPTGLVERSNSSSVEAEERGLPFVFYDKTMHEQAIARMTTLSDLHAAIAAGALELYYHPIVRMADGAACIAGAEALIRWNHPERGLLAPDEFIELAEESRLIAAIDKWALFRSLARLASWLEHFDLFLSMNVSAHEFRDEFLPDIVRAALAQHPQIEPWRLKLELTERRTMHDPASSIEQMRELREIGVEIWIDDFGTGQSSLAYLKQLPATALKIDRGLVEGIDERENDRRYLAGIVESIRARGKRIIAEGVFNAAQARVVESLGCDYVQGYHFAYPMQAVEFEDLLRNGIAGRCTGCAPRVSLGSSTAGRSS